MITTKRQCKYATTKSSGRAREHREMQTAPQTWLEQLVDKLLADQYGDLIAGTVIMGAVGYFVLRIMQGIICGGS